MFKTCKILFTLTLLIGLFWISPDTLYSQVPRSTTTAPTTPKPGAQAAAPVVGPTIRPPSIITQATALVIMSLLPFIVMILTSFLKIVVVLSLLRNALGVQQAPPNQIINGVAFMLSLFIMYPTILKMYDAAEKVIVETKTPDALFSPESAQYIVEISNHAREPLRDFLRKNSTVKHQALFYR